MKEINKKAQDNLYVIFEIKIFSSLYYFLIKRITIFELFSLTALILILVEIALYQKFKYKVELILPELSKDKYLDMENLFIFNKIIGYILTITIMLMSISFTKYLANLSKAI